jgi:hypothetical protein
MLHAYRLVYPDSPHGPERLWEWEKVHVGRLLWNATVFGRELTHRYFLTWEALAQENQRIWETSYLPRPLYEPWETWHAWLEAYRELVRDVQNMYEEHHGRRHNDRRPAIPGGRWSPVTTPPVQLAFRKHQCHNAALLGRIAHVDDVR